MRPLVEPTVQKRICKAPSGERTHDRTLTKRIPCQLSCRGAWRERAHHSLQNTPLRQACCERHRHTSADLATPCVSPPGYPDSWHTAPKHAGSDTEVLHRKAECRLRRDPSPGGRDTRTLGTQPPNTGAATQRYCIARLNIDYAGHPAPAGKARAMEGIPAPADGVLVHYLNHSVILLWLLLREHNYPKQTSQAHSIAKAADHCSRRSAHPMRGIMPDCIPIASSRECQEWA